ncbi:MAG TPA: DMT family transporter [Steroidobacteraceae bacterium]|nr:DMT family transporter [Steroidobacteraceae bacterium]
MTKSARPELTALLALFAGALAIGSSGIFVRVAETGAVASAFWRGALALPPLALWAWLEKRAPPAARAGARGSLLDAAFLWAGVFFAGDIALYHLSLSRTSVGAATLEANTAPIVVTLLVWVVWGERPRLGFLLATLLAFGGLLLIVSPKLTQGGHALGGDGLALGAAWLYAAYILAVARLRARHGTGTVMFASTLIFSVLLLPVPFLLGEKFLPDTPRGWLLLVALALSAQALGQSLIAYALAHLRPTFGSLGLYLQVIAAAVYAWLLLGERLRPVQLAGGVIVLTGIALARASRATRAASPASEPAAASS